MSLTIPRVQVLAIILLHHRQQNAKCRALVWLAFQTEHAAVLLYDSAGDRQAQPGAAFFGREKWLEQPADVLRWNSGAGVLNGHTQLPGAARLARAAGCGGSFNGLSGD